MRGGKVALENGRMRSLTGVLLELIVSFGLLALGLWALAYALAPLPERNVWALIGSAVALGIGFRLAKHLDEWAEESKRERLG